LHRDIKPANLLLDSEGTLWNTDFGLARLPGEDRPTATGDLLGTLRYMSPEQALGRRPILDGRTDIYSLGVTLYEMLTLRPAVEGRDRQELLQRIAGVEPVPPRRLNPSVSVDLETIVLKAMAKDAADRYATARELADDLRRFLEDHPIRARRPSLPERAVKWARRHKPLVAFAAATQFLAVVGLSAGVVLIAGARDRTRAQQRRAERNFELARDAIDQMLTRVGENRLAQVPRMEATRKALLEQALTFYEKLLDDAKDDPAMRLEMGAAWGRVGEIRRQLGRHSEAELAFDRALAILGPMGRIKPRSPRLRRSLAHSFRQRGVLLATTGRAAEAERSLDQAVAALRPMPDEDPGSPRDQYALATTLNTRGGILLNEGRRVEARDSFLEAIQWMDGLVDGAPEQAEYRSRRAGILNNLGIILIQAGRLAEAKGYLEEAVAQQESALKTNPDDLEGVKILASHYENLAIVLAQLGKPGEAETILNRQLVISERLVSDFPLVPEYRDNLAGTLGNLGKVLLEAGKLTEGERVLRRAHDLFAALAAESPGSRRYRRELASSESELGFCFKRQGRDREARDAFERAVGYCQALATGAPDNARYRHELADRRVDLARLLATCPDLSVRDPARAVALADEAVAAAPKAGSHWRALGMARYAAGDWAAAITALKKSTELGSKDEATDWLFLAMAHWRRGEHKTARTWYDKAVAWIDRNKPRNGEILVFRNEASTLLGVVGATGPRSSR
jgi:tetratricopeptide (TPR) repeat protein